MVYLVKNNGNQTLTTDTISTYIPKNVDVYVDDLFIGNYQNISNSSLYLTFVIPVDLINELEEKEYIIKLMSHGALVKSELAQVRDFHPQTIKSYKD